MSYEDRLLQVVSNDGRDKVANSRTYRSLFIMVGRIKPRRLLVRLSVGLWVMIAIACVSVVAYGHLRPVPNRVAEAGLMVCGNVACFRGIIPGRTSWSDAVAAFDGRSTIVDDPYFAKIVLLPSSDRSSLDAILLDMPLDPAISTGTLIALYEAPVCVDTYIYRQHGSVVLHYEGLHIMTRLRDNHFSPYSRILSIVLGTIRAISEQPSHLCSLVDAGKLNGQFIQRPWMGFTTVGRYLGDT